MLRHNQLYYFWVIESSCNNNYQVHKIVAQNVVITVQTYVTTPYNMYTYNGSTTLAYCTNVTEFHISLQYKWAQSVSMYTDMRMQKYTGRPSCTSDEVCKVHKIVKLTQSKNLEIKVTCAGNTSLYTQLCYNASKSTKSSSLLVEQIHTATVHVQGTTRAITSQ